MAMRSICFFTIRTRRDRLLTLVTIGGIEFARFVRDEHGIIGVFAGAGEPHRFTNRHDAFDAAVKRRIAKQRLLR